MRLAVLPGDDIGPEITDATLTVLDAADRTFSLGLEYDVHGVGMQAHKHYGTTLPDAALRAVREADGIILGPAGMTAYPPAPDGGINIPGTIRRLHHPTNETLPDFSHRLSHRRRGRRGFGSRHCAQTRRAMQLPPLVRPFNELSCLLRPDRRSLFAASHTRLQPDVN